LTMVAWRACCSEDERAAKMVERLVANLAGWMAARSAESRDLHLVAHWGELMAGKKDLQSADQMAAMTAARLAER
jgi:hypothetical protein